MSLEGAYSLGADQRVHLSPLISSVFLDFMPHRCQVWVDFHYFITPDHGPRYNSMDSIRLSSTSCGSICYIVYWLGRNTCTCVFYIRVRGQRSQRVKNCIINTWQRTSQWAYPTIAHIAGYARARRNERPRDSRSATRTTATRLQGLGPDGTCHVTIQGPECPAELIDNHVCQPAVGRKYRSDHVNYDYFVGWQIAQNEARFAPPAALKLLFCSGSFLPEQRLACYRQYAIVKLSARRTACCPLRDVQVDE